MDRPFRFFHDHDLTFFFNDLDALTGCGSSFDALANLALSGIPDGGTIAQPTKARMGRDTPSDRAARIREVLAKVPESARILAAHYSPSKWNARRMAADPTLSPLQQTFRAAAGVVARIAEREATVAILMQASTAKADRQHAKAEISRIRKLAERRVEDAQRAYQDAAPKRTRRSAIFADVAREVTP